MLVSDVVTYVLLKTIQYGLVVIAIGALIELVVT